MISFSPVTFSPGVVTVEGVGVNVTGPPSEPDAADNVSVNAALPATSTEPVVSGP